MELVSGQVVDLNLPARVLARVPHVDPDVRITLMILTYDENGHHRNNKGKAADLSHVTLSGSLDLGDLQPGDKQVLVIVGTRHGEEISINDLPAISISVTGGPITYSWIAERSRNRVSILLEAYRRNGTPRLRVVNQGYVDGWRAFSEATKCGIPLETLLKALDNKANSKTEPKVDSDGIGKISISSPPDDDEITSRRGEVRQLEETIRAMQAQASKLRTDYASMRTTYDVLLERVRDLEEAPEWAKYNEVGIYKPRFSYTDSEQYKAARLRTIEDQKRCVSAGRAVASKQEWKVGGDRRAGAEMIKRQIRLTLRAFNGEADAAIASARWNNVDPLEQRIRKAAASINKANESLQVEITPTYVDLKIRELFLTHEFHDQVHREREATAELRRAQREQEKLEREVEKAEREELKYQMLLDRAREEAARGDQTQALQERIAALEIDVAMASKERERAKAMAEQTKSGFVYVISNVGSFGAGIVKIGMTRRLEPQDRIRELSSASVPFAFDTHLLFSSDTASDLEAALHRTFADRRVNTANNRKEFFRCEIDEVERAVQRIIPGATFTRDPDAREWRETVADRKNKLVGDDAIPQSI